MLVVLVPTVTCISSSTKLTKGLASRSCKLTEGKSDWLKVPNILTNQHRWSAICRGATLWGLENAQSDLNKRKTVRSRISRYSYGIIVSREWDTAVGQLETDRIRGTKGEWRANNQMNWMLKKGERVEEGRTLHRDLFESVKVGFGDRGMYQTLSTLSYCADDTPPLRAEPSMFTTRSKCIVLTTYCRRQDALYSELWDRQDPTVCSAELQRPCDEGKVEGCLF